MKYYLIKMLVNTAGQDAPSINVYDTKEAALVAYHNTLASFHNAADVLYAAVEILNEKGNIEALEIVNHTPAPEPPQPVTIVDISVDGNIYTITYSDGTVETFEEPEPEEPEGE